MMLDYQVTPTLSEEMAMEFLALKPRPKFFKKFRFPFLLAICFACLAAEGNHRLVIMDRGYPNVALVSDIIVGSLMGFGIGWVGLISARDRIRRAIISQIRGGAAAALSARTFTWDEMGIGITSPVWRYEWKWTAVDAIWDGAVAVHFLWNSQLLCSVPKQVLRSATNPENLREMWRRYAPPILPN